MSGRVGDLSPKQEAALEQLKESVKDVAKADWDDYYYLRWLRARRFDLKKAEQMLRDNVAWRKHYKADQLLSWKPPEVLEKYWAGGYIGQDKEGSPILIDAKGLLDVKGLYYSVNKRDILRYYAQILERITVLLPELSKKYGRRIEQVTVITDLDHIGRQHLWKPAIDTYTDMLAISEANYPEILKVSYIINAPKIFPVLWNIVKVFLNEDTRHKIKVCGRNYKQKLLETIDADVLPVHWGGEARDPDGDECCRSKIRMGGKIPDNYRLANVRENVDLANFERCTVQKGSSLQLEYDVKEVGSSLRWEFLSEENDIGFGVYRRTSGERQKKGEMEEIVRSHRVNSHVVPDEGSIIITEPGTYVVRFDNTYSWMSAKKIDYLIEVLVPDKGEDINGL